MVRDLASGASVGLLDLGAAVHAEDDGWLVGRLVPSGTSPAMMFDSRPLPVDEETAREVADSSDPGGWITALTDAFDDGRLDRAILRSEDRELATDVPSLMLVEAGTPPPALAHTMESLRHGRDEVGRAALRILRGAADGSLAESMAAYVAAAALNPHAWVEAVPRVVSPGQEVAWTRWAALAAEPARGRLLGLAALSASSVA